MQGPSGNVRQSLITAAVACIERQGLDAVTIRSVAREAGVNSAAISYYFGSKEQLIQAALEHMSRQAFADWEEVVGVGLGDPRKELETFLLHWLGGVLAHPNLTRSLLFSPVTKPEAALSTQQFSAFVDSVLERLGSGAFRDERNAKVSLVQIFSAVIFIGLTPRVLIEFSGKDFSLERNRRLFVAHLVGHYLKDERAGRGARACARGTAPAKGER